MARRLAFATASEYAVIPYAMWCRSQAGVGRKEIGSIEANEEEMGRGMGRMQETEGTRGVFVVITRRSTLTDVTSMHI